MSRHSMRYVVASLVAVGLMVGIALNAGAQAQITLLSPNPIEATINKLTADFEKKSGIHVNVTYGTGVSTRKDVAAGKAQDVSLLFSPFPEALRTGNVIPNSATVIAPTIPVNCVLAPAASATGVREELLLIGKPWKNPAARLAAPSPTIS